MDKGAGDSLRVSEPKKKGARSADKTFLSFSMRVGGQTNAVSVCGRPLMTVRSRTYSSQNYLFTEV
jgi:hypothetical protein